MEIKVFTQAAIKLIAEEVIYCDPFKIEKEYNDADYIFITHDHYDHFDVESIKKVIQEKTILIVPKCLEKEGLKITNNVVVVEPNKDYKVGNVSFNTVAAYNINKKYHPKDMEYVGYNILIEGKYYYIMGDCDVTEEARKVKCDVCFVPIGGTFTMDVIEASSYINEINPHMAIPIHYGSIVGDKSLGREFRNKVKKEIEVKILL